MGLEPHNSVCIYGFNSPEWFFADIGAIFAGAKVILVKILKVEISGLIKDALSFNRLGCWSLSNQQRGSQ